MQASTRVLRSHSEKAAAPKDGSVLHPLPADVLSHIFLLVPVLDRARCRKVCRAWRVFLEKPELWRVLDLSRLAAPETLRLLIHEQQGRKLRLLVRGASAAAAQGGGLEVLDTADAPVYGYDSVQVDLLRQELFSVVRQNAPSLRVVRFLPGVQWQFNTGELERLLGAAPLPRLAELSLDATARGCFMDIQRWADLLSSPRGAAVALRSMRICAEQYSGRPAAEAGPLAGALRALGRALGRGAAVVPDTTGGAPRPPRLGALNFVGPFPFADAELAAAVADAAIESRAEALSLVGGPSSIGGPAFLPQLSRLLRAKAGGLRRLELRGEDLRWRLADFCAALRASRLTSLALVKSHLWRLQGPNFAAIVEALHGHPTLRHLEISDDVWPGWEAEDGGRLEKARAVAGLIAADSPAFRHLTIACLDTNVASLSFAGLGAIFGALRDNSHLEVLGLGPDPDSAAAQHLRPFLQANRNWPRFIRDHVVPAVRACGSLREVRWAALQQLGGFAEVREVLEARRRSGGGGGGGSW